MTFHKFNDELEFRLYAFLAHLETALPIGIDPKGFVAANPRPEEIVAQARILIGDQAGAIPKVQRDAMGEWLTHWLFMVVLASATKTVPDRALKALAVATYEEHLAAADLLMRALTDGK